MNDKQPRIAFTDRLKNNWLDVFLYAIFALALLQIGKLYLDIDDQEDNWNAFKEEHHCRLKTSGDRNIHSAWICDDGKTHYRWRQLKG